MRQRLRDALAGAAVAVALLGLALAVVVWLATSPAGTDRASAPEPGPTATAPAGDPQPPADLSGTETWLGDVDLDSGTVVTGGSLLRDVRAVGSDVRTGPDGVVAGRLAVDATVPFDVVAEQLGPGTTVRPADGAGATVERTVRFAGRELRVVATGTVRAERGLLVLEPRSVDVGGPDVLADALGSLVRRFGDVEHRVQGLPEGLVLRDVRVQDDGFRAALSGVDVRLAP